MVHQLLIASIYVLPFSSNNRLPLPRMTGMGAAYFCAGYRDARSPVRPFPLMILPWGAKLGVRSEKIKMQRSATITCQICNKELMDYHQLVKDCLKRETAAQKRLYEHFAAGMLGICYRYTKSMADAEDVLQDGFILVFRNLHQFNFAGELGGGSAGSW